MKRASYLRTVNSNCMREAHCLILSSSMRSKKSINIFDKAQFSNKLFSASLNADECFNTNKRSANPEIIKLKRIKIFYSHFSSRTREGSSQKTHSNSSCPKESMNKTTHARRPPSLQHFLMNEHEANPAQIPNPSGRSSSRHSFYKTSDVG